MTTRGRTAPGCEEVPAVPRTLLAALLAVLVAGPEHVHLHVLAEGLHKPLPGGAEVQAFLLPTSRLQHPAPVALREAVGDHPGHGRPGAALPVPPPRQVGVLLAKLVYHPLQLLAMGVSSGLESLVTY